MVFLWSGCEQVSGTAAFSFTIHQLCCWYCGRGRGRDRDRDIVRGRDRKRDKDGDGIRIRVWDREWVRVRMR